MRHLARLVSGLRNLLASSTRERELDQELREHFALLVDEKIAAGLAPDDARRLARLEMQGVEQVKEAVRDVSAGIWLEQLGNDLRIGARVLRKSPGFTLAATVTLGLALGANAAVFSVVDAALLQPLPYPQPERLVLLWGERAGETRRQVSATDIADVRSGTGSFVDVATFSDWTPIVTGAGDPERITGTQIGDGFFNVMSVPPMLGRIFTAEDQIPGKDRVIILSHGLWRQRFNADPGVVGRTVRLSGLEYEIVGVMPPGLPSLPPTLLSAPGEFYRPVAEPYDNSERSSRHLRAIARLKPGVDLAAAQRELDGLTARLAAEFPASNAGYLLRVVPLREDTVGALEPTLWLLMGGVVTVLLIGCVNLTNLLLARTHARQQEIAMRVALGASRWRLSTQLLSESLLIATMGGILGAGMAALVLATLTPTALAALPQLAVREPAVNGAVLVAVGLLTLVAALLVSAIPIVQVRRSSLRARIEPVAARAAHTGALARGLVASEIALALMLVFTAGLVVKSFQRLHAVDTGFVPENRLVMNVWLPWAKYREASKNLPFYRELLQKLEAQPGVRAAGLVSTLPLRSFDQRGLEVEGKPSLPGEVPSPDSYFASPGYLAAMGIPVLEGRGFTDSDHERAPLVALVNLTAARTLFGGASPLGRRVRFYTGQPDSAEPWREIVGVVADVPQYGLERPPSLQVYVPQAQVPTTAMVLVVHTDVEPLSLVSAIRQQIRAIDPELAASQVSTMEELVASSVAGRKLSASLAAGFAVLALLLGTFGIYGVVSNWVSRATHEIGIRIALGATPGQVRHLVFRRGLGVIALGLVAGGALGLGVSQVLSAYLFEVEPGDFGIFVSSVGLLALAALVAIHLPARRAMRVDPIISLRAE